MADDKKVTKNPCPDCTFCQYCSNTRCSLCKQPACKKEKKGAKVEKPLFRPY